MARLRYNGLRSTLGGSGLTNSATSVTFAAALTHSNGTAVPTITGSDYIPLTILDSNGHLSEVVWLTAYTSGATTGTIARGKEGTTGVAHSSGDVIGCMTLAADVGESFDDAIAAISGAVHRWKFDETSGATVADSVGSLNLTFNGTAGTNYNRNITGPTGLGLAAQFISAKASSSGIGSIPVGAADRTVALVFRTSSQNTQQIPFTWGTSAAYQLFYISLNDSGAAAALGHMTPAVGGGADLLDMPQVPISDGAWHLAFAGLRGGTGKNRFGYIDGIYAQGTYTTAANTVSTGAIDVGGSGSNQFVGDIADLTVFNRALTRSEMDRMFRAAFPNA